MFRNRVLRAYCGCFKCLLSCSFRVTWCVQIKSVARNRVAGTLCTCRSGLIPPVPALVSSAHGPLAGGDGESVTSAPALQENSTSWLSRMGGWDRLQVKWWERSIDVWVAEKGSPRNVSWVQSSPWKHQFLVVWDNEWFPFTDLLLWKI